MMGSNHRTISKFMKWLLIFVAWTLGAFFFASQAVTQLQAYGQTISFFRVLLWQSVSGYVWFALLPTVLWLGKRFPLERGRWQASLPAHLIAGSLLAMTHQLIDALVLPYFGYPLQANFNSFFERYKFFLLLNFHLGVLIYWIALGVQHTIGYYQKYRERELRASQLETRLAESRLQILKMQLHPHFLFNTLNTISELVYKDPDAAELMITNLSDLLRLSLETVGVQEVPLHKELDFLKKYLDIEQTRFHDRLQVRLDIDPQTLDASVPNMILQPLVENAIRHGIAPRASGGSVEIGAARENGSLHLRISDDGCGIGRSDTNALKEGVGLSNTRARLDQLYGAEHRFALQASPAGGLSLDLLIPFRRDGLVSDENSRTDR